MFCLVFGPLVFKCRNIDFVEGEGSVETVKFTVSFRSLSIIQRSLLVSLG